MLTFAEIPYELSVMEYPLHYLSVSVNRIIEIPMLFLFGKDIYCPEKAVKNSINLQEIIRHETMHYQHLDPVWNLFRCLITAIYWFNPFVWLASFLSRQDAEYACALKIYGSFPMMVLVINGER